MLERHSHIRLAAKQAAIQSLEVANFNVGSPQSATIGELRIDSHTALTEKDLN
jgi:hypothetical protein